MKKLYEKCIALLGRIAALNVPLYASQASFFLALSVFPLLVLLMGLVRYTGLDVADLTEMLHGVLPTALMPAAQKLISKTYQSTTGMVLSISALTALWSASLGIHGLRMGLNAIAHVQEKRNWLLTRLISVVYTVLFLVVLLLTLALHVLGTGLLHQLPFADSPIFNFLENIVDFRFFLLLAVQTIVFCGIFAYLPSRRSRIRDVFPGAVFASLGWLIFTQIYSIYVEYFAGLSIVYGSVYAVALSLLWLYFCISIVFYGGALNQWLRKKPVDELEEK